MECYVKGNSFQFLLETEGHTIWGISPVSCKNSYYLEILWNSRERAWGCKIPKVTVDQSDLVFSCPLLPEKEEEKRNYYRIPRWIFASETRVETKRKKERKETRAGLFWAPGWQHKSDHSNSLYNYTNPGKVPQPPPSDPPRPQLPKLWRLCP